MQTQGWKEKIKSIWKALLLTGDGTIKQSRSAEKEMSMHIVTISKYITLQKHIKEINNKKNKQP